MHHQIDLCFEEISVIPLIENSAGSKLGEVELPYFSTGLASRSLGCGQQRFMSGLLALRCLLLPSFPLLPRTRPRVIEVFFPGALECCAGAFTQFLPSREGHVSPAGKRACFVAVAAAQNDRGLQTPATPRPRRNCRMAAVLVVTGDAVP